MNNVPGYNSRKNGLPPTAPPIGFIGIKLGQDGKVYTEAQVPGKVAMLGMIEAAKIALIARFEEAEAKAKEGPGIQIAPPGIAVDRNEQ